MDSLSSDPWFFSYTMEVNDIWERYADDEDWLPCESIDVVCEATIFLLLRFRLTTMPFGVIGGRTTGAGGIGRSQAWPDLDIRSDPGKVECGRAPALNVYRSVVLKVAGGMK